MGDWHKWTAHALAEELAMGRLSSEELTKEMIARVENVDGQVEAYLETTFETALETAREVDTKRAKGEKLPPLAGIPYALKDNICTDGIKTTCASRMLENFTPMYDAAIVERLKAEQGPMLGKLNMDEFAMGSSTETSYFKKTHNPHDLNRIPGGSSGGSAAAVSAGMACYAIGTDTGGSIRQPAAHCGVVGLKPTYGRVPRYGVVAFASSLDQAGPLTRDVTDAALVLNVLSGSDKRDASSLPVETPDFTAGLTDGVKGLRVGLPKEYLDQNVQPTIRDAIMKTAKILEEQGAIVEETTLPCTEYALPAFYIISAAEACSNMGRYDGIRYGYRAPDYDGMMDMICRSRNEGLGAEVKRRILMGTYALSAGYYDAYYKRAQQTRTLIIQDFQRAFETFDVLLTPTSPITAWEFGAKNTPMEMYAADVCTVAISVAGLPAISLPVGVNEDSMPIGAQLIGPALGEPTILRAAYAVEQAVDIPGSPLL